MSTILQTLKKLEEDRGILDQDADLEDMVTRGGIESPRFFDHGALVKIIAASIGVIALCVAGAIWLWPGKQAKPAPAAALVAAAPPAAPAKTPPVAPSQRNERDNRQHQGIALADIPAAPPAAPAKTAAPVIKTAPAAPPIAAVVPSAPNAAADATSTAAVIVEDTVEDEPAPPPAEEREELIDLSRLKALKTSKPHAPAASAPPDERPVERPRQPSISIPGLKIKGIVFFSENNPANYILVSTGAGSNTKLHAGESAQGATLRAIQGNRAVFDYQGRTAEVGMGG